jgi:hypothetical protein
MEVYHGDQAVNWRDPSDQTQEVLLSQVFEVEGFNLRAYSELEAYFEEPQPYLDIELTSAGVITLDYC